MHFRAYLRTVHLGQARFGSGVSVCGVRSLRSLRGASGGFLGDDCGIFQFLPVASSLHCCIVGLDGFAGLEGYCTGFGNTRTLSAVALVSKWHIMYDSKNSVGTRKKSKWF